MHVCNFVDQGKSSVDSADQVDGLCPEMREIKILNGFDENGEAVLVEKKNRISLMTMG